MSILSIEAKNFLIHKELKIDLNKESAIIIGDSGVGKSTLSRLILAHIAQEQYPTNPLSDGEDSGYSKTTHQGPDGKVYTVSRKYVRGEDGSVKLDRFEVRGPDGYKKSLEQIMDTVFNGVFTSSRFSWNHYFKRTKSYEERFKYFVDAMGDTSIEENLNKIPELEKERGNVGSDRKTQKALMDQADIDEETVEAKVEYFSQQRSTDEAAIAKKEHLKKQIDLSDLEAKLNNHAKSIELVKHDQEVISGYQEEINAIDLQIMELQRKRSEKEAQIVSRQNLRNEQLKNQLTDKQLSKLAAEILKKEKANKVIQTEAEAIYQEKLKEVVDFMAERRQFADGIKAMDKYIELDAKWEELDTKIKDLKKENEQKLKSILPLPELSIGEKKQKDGSVKPIVLYKGREFSDEFLSTGEQIEITAAIQIALNPNGDNFIVIPNAQDLGSRLRDVQEACKKFNVQYLVEMTKPDEEFRVEIIDSEKEVIL